MSSRHGHGAFVETLKQGREGGKHQESSSYYKPISTTEGFDYPYVKKHQHGAESMKEHLDNRKMTDVFCSCVFFAFWIGVACILSHSFEHGDPRRLYHGFNYNGSLCGVDAGVVNKNLLYWPDQDRLDLPICVSTCPTSNFQPVVVPRESLVTTNGGDYKKTEIMRSNTTLMSYPTKKVGGRLCLPINGTGGSLTNVSKAIVGKEMYSAFAVAMDSLKEVDQAWAVLFLAVPVALVVGYLYMLMVRYCAKVVILGATFALTFVFVSLVVYFHNLENPADEAHWINQILGRFSDSPQNMVEILMYVCIGLTVFFAIIAGLSLSRIDKIAAVVQTAAESMWSVWFLNLMPMCEVTAKIIFTVAWIYGASYVISNGEIAHPVVVIGGHPVHGLVCAFHYNMMQLAMIIIYVLAFFWGLEFISMVFYFAISYVVSSWYFLPCRLDMSKPDVTPNTWRSGFYFALCYHAGSLALGAAVLIILGVFTPFNFFLEWVTSYVQGSDNPCVKCVEYSCACVTKCVQEVAGAVNKGALVELVLRGDSDFFESAAVSVRMMKQAKMSTSYHRKGIVALHGVTLSFQAVGMVITTIAGGFATYWVVTRVNIFSDPHSSFFCENVLGITLVAAFFSGIVSTVFVWTLDLVGDTLLFCWLVEDEEEKMHSKFAPKFLRNLVFDDIDQRDKWSKEGHESLNLKQELGGTYHK